MKVAYPRTIKMRKPDGFAPAVQRWSAIFPEHCSAVYVGFFAVQAWEEVDIQESGFDAWAADAFANVHAPVTVDYSAYTDEFGYINRIATAYWTDGASFNSWKAGQWNGWWDAKEREQGKCGFWKELLSVPIERIETLYWQDYPVGLSKVLDIFATQTSGYYGAMRDRIPLASFDPLHSGYVGGLEECEERATQGGRWIVSPPHNFAVIRSGTFWGNCDDEQKSDFFENLRGPLERGMAYLRDHREETGCCALRYQQTRVGNQLIPETHAHGYFLSLSHLENWAENHQSHSAIFGAALARYQKYGAKNQLRTWHEVYVLPEIGQHFEYINCHPQTGLLPFFSAVKVG